MVTLLELDQKLLENNADWIQHLVTDVLAATTSVVSTHLQNYRATPDYFNEYWIYIDNYNNIGTYRKVTDDDGTSTLTVLASWVTDTGTQKATFRINRFGNWAQRTLAINQAINEVYPKLFVPITDTQLITNNILPPWRWNSAGSALDIWTTENVTSIAETNTVGFMRGAASSCKVTASATGGAVKVVSGQYPVLLDLMNKTISVYAWANPEEDNDAYITISTAKTTSTGLETQTLSSTTASIAGSWNLIKLENQTISDDIISISILFRVKTLDKYVYYAQPRLVQWSLYDYLLPTDFDDGSINQVYIQAGNYADYPADDLVPRTWERVYGFDVYEKMVLTTPYKYIHLPFLYGDNRQIKLVGDRPFTTFSSLTSSGSETIELDGHRLNLLIEYASYRLFKNLQSGVSSEDRILFEVEAMKHLGEYYRLLRTHAMPRKSGTMKINE